MLKKLFQDFLLENQSNEMIEPTLILFKLLFDLVINSGKPPIFLAQFKVSKKSSTQIIHPYSYYEPEKISSELIIFFKLK